MSPTMMAPSQVDPARHWMRLIGMTEPAPVLWTRPGGVDPSWGCPVTDIAVEGAPEPLRQPESLKVEVWR